MKLHVAGLNSYYGQAHVLSDLAVDVGGGEAVALLGRNGAGKSTTLRSIIGLVAKRRGTVLCDGEDISRMPTHAIVRRGLGYVPEDRRIFTELTVEENLLVGRRAARAGAPTWTVEQLFNVFPKLAELRRRPAGHMSGGEQQMLTIARTLMGNPSIILLDEPSEGLAPKIIAQMADMITCMKQQGLGMLIAEQNMRFARLISDRAYVIEKGKIRFSGSMAEIAARADIRDAYLGL